MTPQPPGEGAPGHRILRGFGQQGAPDLRILRGFGQQGAPDLRKNADIL